LATRRVLRFCTNTPGLREHGGEQRLVVRPARAGLSQGNGPSSLCRSSPSNVQTADESMCWPTRSRTVSVEDPNIRPISLSIVHRNNLLPVRLTNRPYKDNAVEDRQRVGIMLCMFCGAEMRLVKVEQDDSLMVTGYEHRTFECSSCQEVERRLTFTHEATPHPGEPVSVDPAPVPSLVTKDQNEAAPPMSPASTDQDEAAPSMSPVSVDKDDAAPPPSVPFAGHNEAVAPSRWTRALAKLRGREKRGS
jgi:hypothetical protein